VPRAAWRTSIVAAIAMALALTACGGGDDDGENGGELASGEKVTVTWWGHTNPAFIKANQQMITRFERENPNISIKFQNFPYNAFWRKLQAAYRAGNASDMQQIYGSFVTEYAENGLLDPVPDEYASDLEDRFLPATLGASQIDDKFHAMPNDFNMEMGGMLLNPKLFKDAGIDRYPETWDELIATSKKLTAKSGDKVDQIGFAFSRSPEAPPNLLMSLIVQQGDDFWADDGVHVDFSTEAAKTAWLELTGLVTEHGVDHPQWSSGDPFEEFFRGHAAMAMRGPWVIAIGQEQFPDFKFEYVAIPPFAGEDPKFVAESAWAEVVNASAEPEVKAAAWEFIDFMHREENLRDWCITAAVPCALKSLVGDEQMLEQAPYLQVAFDVMPHSQFVGPVQDRDRFWISINDAFSATVLGKKDALVALADAEEEINAMIDEKIGP
jgi:multiple sugar transport system substrate-binding protein